MTGSRGWVSRVLMAYKPTLTMRAVEWVPGSTRKWVDIVVNVQCCSLMQTIIPTSCMPVRAYGVILLVHRLAANIEKDGVYELPSGCWRNLRSFRSILTGKSAGPPEAHPCRIS
jgi:hypothetical protein